MRKVGTRVGLAALGAYLASVGTMLGLRVAGELPAWLGHELVLGLATSSVVGVVAAVVGACLVFATAVGGDGAAEHREGRPFAASTAGRGALERVSGPTPAARPVAAGAARTGPNQGRAPVAGGRAGLAREIPGQSEAGPGAEVPDGKSSEAPSRVESADQAEAQASRAPRSSAVLDPGTLIDCWRRYRDEGDGHFRADGLREELTGSGFALEVIEGRDLGAGEDVLVVPTGAPGGACFLVPSFAKAPDAVGRWFEDRGDRSLSRRVNHIAEVAEGKRTADGVELVRKGAVS